MTSNSMPQGSADQFPVVQIQKFTSEEICQAIPCSSGVNLPGGSLASLETMISSSNDNINVEVEGEQSMLKNDKFLYRCDIACRIVVAGGGGAIFESMTTSDTLRASIEP